MSTLFQSLGQSSEMSLAISGVFNVLQLVAVSVCSLLFNSVGRRPLAIASGFGTAVAYIVIAVLSALHSKNWQAHALAGWACIAMAFLFILIYGVPYEPLGWAILL